MIDEYSDNRINTDDLKPLTSFLKRINHNRKNLGRSIGSGSSRVVWLLDNNKVIKLAKNKKGVAQNEVEVHNSDDYYIGDIFPKIFEYDEDGYNWIVSECCPRAKASDVLEITGLKYGLFVYLCRKLAAYYDNTERRCTGIINDDEEEKLRNAAPMFYEYIVNYQPIVGEIVSLRNLGVATRPEGKELVIIDSGLNDDVWKEFYMKK